MKHPMLARTLLVAAVAVAVLFPITMIEGKISERRARANDVVAQFAQETSGPQVVFGPFLAMTCEETVIVERQVKHAGKEETEREPKTQPCSTVFFAPRTFKADATVPVETLHRGLYSIRLFRAGLEMSGELEWPAPPSIAGAVSRDWKQAYLVSYVKDPRGIKTLSSASPEGLLANPGIGAIEQFSIRQPLGAWSDRKPGTSLAFDYKMTLVGTSSLMIAPVGDQSEIHLTSNWPHPSFSTSWSPDVRKVGAQGFDASWRMTDVATGGQAAWRSSIFAGTLASVPAAGVSMFDPVNVYTLSYRATEYAFLFVLFTFSTLALVEVIAGIRLHPIQYALVGSALAVFFLLLLALSEHVSFQWAYGASAAACVALLVFYLRHPLRTWKMTAMFLALFAVLYGYLYETLMSEDDALLMGSLVTFAILAIAMLVTRKVDWSAISARMVAPAAAGAS